MDDVIGDDGTISVANIDHPIQAAGKSPQALAEEIRTNLVPDIYTHANVTIIPQGQFFYVTGQVNLSAANGRIPYLSRITVSAAIAAAGGFNDFAAKHRVQVTRLDGSVVIVDCVKALKNPKLDLEVFPGDKIYVDRRSLWEAGSGQ